MFHCNCSYITPFPYFLHLLTNYCVEITFLYYIRLHLPISQQRTFYQNNFLNFSKYRVALVRFVFVLFCVWHLYHVRISSSYLNCNSQYYGNIFCLFKKFYTSKKNRKDFAQILLTDNNANDIYVCYNRNFDGTVVVFFLHDANFILPFYLLIFTYFFINNLISILRCLNFRFSTRKNNSAIVTQQDSAKQKHMRFAHSTYNKKKHY